MQNLRWLQVEVLLPAMRENSTPSLHSGCAVVEAVRLPKPREAAASDDQKRRGGTFFHKTSAMPGPKLGGAILSPRNDLRVRPPKRCVGMHSISGHPER